jgi:4-alpha-glucanotransferase
MTMTAGAPPDMYTEEGQVWGFPIFKWDVMKEHNYNWWKQRLDIASNLYDIYRIDHILGFFRIWAIPLNSPSKEGRFIPEDQALWLAHGKELLSMMAANCPMLPIGEDLGLVPDAVRTCLAELGICGTKVPRWERNWDAGGYFIPAQEYNPISMTTVSTHDSETLGQWWSHYRDEAKAYADMKHWDCGPELTDTQRRYILWESHHSSSLFHINLLSEYLALFPELVWKDPQQERINIPGKVLPENWTYRTRQPLEKIVAHEGLRKGIEAIVHAPDPHSLFD